MNCDRKDWVTIAEVLVRKKILAPISQDALFRVRGRMLLNGIFAVEKKGVPAPGECRITRLTMNCVPPKVGDLPP